MIIILAIWFIVVVGACGALIYDYYTSPYMGKRWQKWLDENEKL